MNLLCSFSLNWFTEEKSENYNWLSPLFFQGKRVDENVTNGIILGNQTLVIQAVNTSHAGLYTCVASNVVADGESNALMLDIKCKSDPGLV